MSLERKRELRTRFMSWLYEVTDGSEQKFVDPEAFKDEHPIDDDELASVITYLEGENLLKADAYSLGSYLPGIVQISHYGVRELEDAIGHPEASTEHFTPLVNITTIHGNVTGSQIQQGSPGASQTGQFEFDADLRQQVLKFAQAVREALPELTLDADTEAEVGSDIGLLEREARRDSPRLGVLRDVAQSLRAVLESAAGGAGGTGLVAAAMALWPHLPH